MTKAKTKIDKSEETDETLLEGKDAESKDTNGDADTEDLKLGGEDEPVASEEGEEELPVIETPKPPVGIQKFGEFSIDLRDPKHVIVKGDLVNTDLGECSFEAAKKWLEGQGLLR